MTATSDRVAGPRVAARDHRRDGSARRAAGRTRVRNRSVLLAALALAVLAAPASATPAAAGPSDCPDHLVTFTRDEVTGDARAVAITAQSLVWDEPGWDHLSWAAADGVQIRTVLVTGTDGAVRTVTAAATGTVEAVTAVTFCGHTPPAHGVVGTTPPSVITTPAVERRTTPDVGARRPAAPLPPRASDPTDPESEASPEPVADPGEPAPGPTDDTTPTTTPSGPAPSAGGAVGATASDTAGARVVDQASDASTLPVTAAMDDTADAGAVPVTTSAGVAAAANSSRWAADASSDTEVLGVRVVAPPRTGDAGSAPDVDDEATTTTEVPAVAAASLLDDAPRTGIHPLLLAALLAAGLASGVAVLRGSAQPATLGTTEGDRR